MTPRDKLWGWGGSSTSAERGLWQDSDEERQAWFEKIWTDGGFRLWLANYIDYVFDARANRVVYDFWTHKVRERIEDPKQRDLLAPLEPHHPFGVRRLCLEQDYFEQFNRPTVEVVDIKTNPITCFTETGIQLQEGIILEVDVICVATGFDIVTAGITNIGLRSIHGRSLQDEWKSAAHTYRGTTISGYPNMFHFYGPHGPTLLSNGPTSVEVQGRWIADAIKQMERRSIRSIDSTPEASRTWKRRINELSNHTLLHTTKSSYMGGTVPAKPFEQANYCGGTPMYANEIRAVLPGFEGFTIVQ